MYDAVRLTQSEFIWSLAVSLVWTISMGVASVCSMALLSAALIDRYRQKKTGVNGSLKRGAYILARSGAIRLTWSGFSFLAGLGGLSHPGSLPVPVGLISISLAVGTAISCIYDLNARNYIASAHKARKEG